MLELIAKIKSGSHLYGLETESSDLDYYSIGLNTELENIIGLGKEEYEISKTESNDSQTFELRRFFQFCRKSTTQAYELLHLPPQNFIYLNPLFEKLVLDKKENFIDSKNLFKCIMGYSQSERRIMTGEAIGRLGEKRKKQVEEFGYCFKNACNLLRILKCGIVFYKTGVYPTTFKKIDPQFHDFLFDIKTRPEIGRGKELLKISCELEAELKSIFDGRDKSKDLSFNNEYVSKVILSFYAPKIILEYTKI